MSPSAYPLAALPMAILDSAPPKTLGPTRDLRVESFKPLVPPAILLEEIPLTPEATPRLEPSTATASGRPE